MVKKASKTKTTKAKAKTEAPAAPAAPAPKESPKLSLKVKLLVAKDKIMAFEPKVYIDKASAMVEKARINSKPKYNKAMTLQLQNLINLEKV